MKLKKKTILIISGISVAVVVLSLGVGLGIAFSSSSSSSNPNNISQIYRVGNYAFEKSILDEGKITIDGKDYSIIKENNEYLLDIPGETNLELSGGSLEWPLFDYTDNYNITTSNNLGKGKDGFFDISASWDYMNIGPIRIVGKKIYAGYEANREDGRLVSITVNNKLENKYPNAYEIGSFDNNGNGGINLLKVQKLQALLDDDSTTTEENAPTKTVFKILYFSTSLDGVITKKVNVFTNIYANEPQNIGYNPPTGTRIDEPQIGWPSTSSRKRFLGNRSLSIEEIQNRETDIVFKIQGFKRRDGSDYPLILSKDDPIGTTIDVDLNELYFPIKYNQGFYKHPLLGKLSVSSINKIVFPDTFVSPTRETLVTFGKFSLPRIKLKLKQSKLNEETYATYTNERFSNELLIDLKEEWYDYFVETANLREVKELAKRYGITIRFKKSNVYEIESEENVCIRNENDSEVFFFPMKKFSCFRKSNQINPFKYILKTNLNNPNYYDDYLRKKSTLLEGNNQGELAIFPFGVEKRLIAYNKDYFPNGLDFTNKDLSDYLYQGDLGDMDTIENTLKTKDDISENAKHGLLLMKTWKFGSSIWAHDFYAERKKDQEENQLDFLWKVKGTEKDYYSPVADPNLKDDKRFQAWLDHYKNANSLFREGLMEDQALYIKRALHNGHIGSIIINTNLIDDVWRGINNKGFYRSVSGETDNEKRSFIEQKIGYQALPNNGIFRTLNGAIINTMENDPKKQEVAEMFLNMLTDPNRAGDLFQNTNSLTPRKNPNVDHVNDEITKKVLTATKNLPYSALDIYEVLDVHIIFAWSNVTNTITDSTTYESAANTLKFWLSSRRVVGDLLPPVDPS